MISESCSSKELSSAELHSKIFDKFKSKGILDTVKVNICISLKLLSAIFIKFILSLNDSPSKTVKNAFCFILKALVVLRIINFFYFCPSLFFYLSAIALEDDRR